MLREKIIHLLHDAERWVEPANVHSRALLKASRLQQAEDGEDAEEDGEDGEGGEGGDGEDEGQSYDGDFPTVDLRNPDNCG